MRRSGGIYDGKGDYTDRVYFREGITGTNIIHVTATAEDGVTETTYTFVLTPDGNYDGLRSVYVTITDQEASLWRRRSFLWTTGTGTAKLRTTMCSARCMRNTARTV